jgi:hypothetical protein
MTVDQLRRLLIAPEIIVLDVTVASLVALERALLLEHPLLSAPPSSDDPNVRARARVPSCVALPACAAHCASTAASSTSSRARPTTMTGCSEPSGPSVFLILGPSNFVATLSHAASESRRALSRDPR